MDGYIETLEFYKYTFFTICTLSMTSFSLIHFFFLYQGFKAKYKYMMKVKSTTAMLAKFYVPENQ